MNIASLVFLARYPGRYYLVIDIVDDKVDVLSVRALKLARFPASALKVSIP